MEIKNTASSSEPLINISTSGSFSPAVSNPLPAFSTTYHVSVTTPTDVGVIEYLSCRFNWSAIKVGSMYQFFKGAIPATGCRATVLLQNFVTGEYSLRFEIL